MPWWWSPLEPDADAGNNARVLYVVGLFAPVVSSAAVSAFPHHTDIGRKLAVELVTQAEARFQRAQAAADAALRIVLAPCFGSDQPLADQPVGEQRLVLGSQPEPGLARLAQVGRGIDLELVRRHVHDADGSEGRRWPL